MFSAPKSAGFSTIECLVALVILAVGILGSAGTMGLAVRSVHAGAAASNAARLVLSVRDSLAAQVRLSGGRCGGLTAGGARGPHDVGALWQVSTAAGGATVELTVTRPSLRGRATDTLNAFLPCD